MNTKHIYTLAIVVALHATCSLASAQDLTVNGNLKQGGNTTTGWRSTAFGQNSDATGSWALAGGYNTTASGDASFSIGLNTTASNHYSFSYGDSTTSSGWCSFSGGKNTTASGTHAFSLGLDTVSSGKFSFAHGDNAKSESYASVAFGKFNVGGYSSTGNVEWIATDPIFEIGIGTSNSNRDNAVTVLKNGNTGIGDATPDEKLVVADGNIKITNGDIEITGTGKIILESHTGDIPMGAFQ